jgi:hypothetical protein
LAESGGKVTITTSFNLAHWRSSAGVLGFTLTFNRVDCATEKAEVDATSIGAEPAESKTALRTLRDKTPKDERLQATS